jgi:DNA polymerase-3 subunit alpha
MMMGGGSDGDVGVLDHAENWPEGLKLKYEKETLGFYITGHPLRKYSSEVKTYSNATTGTLAEKPSGFDVAIGGIVSAIRQMRTKKGDPMAIIQFEDWDGIVEVLVFPDTYAKTQRLLEADAVLFIKGKLDNDEASMKILASDIYPMDRVREVLSRTVTIHINLGEAPQDIAERLQPVIDEKRGAAEIVFELELPGRYTAFVRPNPYVKISPDRECVAAIERICGLNTVRLS